MKTAIVILNWNGKKLLEQFLPSILQWSHGATIFVADNASTDDSVDYIRNTFKDVEVVVNATNGGYAKGYNDALKHIEADIYVLLNSDVEVTKDWLEPVISEFEKNPNLAAAQPKILDYRQKEYFEYAGAGGGFIDKYAFPYCRGRLFSTLEKDQGQYDDIKEIFWASGACLFVRSTEFHAIGGFDEDYFAHQEEIDLCWRLKANGKSIIAVGSSTIYHVGGATLNSVSPQKTFLNYRNSLFNLYKNRKSNILSTIFIRLCLDGISGIYFVIQGKPKHVLAIIRAHFSFYRNLGKMKKKRKHYASDFDYFQLKNLPFEYFIKKNKTFKSLL